MKKLFLIVLLVFMLSFAVPVHAATPTNSIYLTCVYKPFKHSRTIEKASCIGFWDGHPGWVATMTFMINLKTGYTWNFITTLTAVEK